VAGSAAVTHLVLAAYARNDMIVVGRDRYHQIQLNHRPGYVRAADVVVLP
jgi:hypothetical protein